MADTQSKLLPGGLVIALEGIDGAGKTTQIELAREALEKAAYIVETSRNLGGTPIGEKLREVMLSPLERPNETNLYISVAIQEALIDAIKNSREQGKLILMDRGPLSLAAYAIYGDGLDESLGWPHVERGISQLRPELTIIYKADIDTALEQARQKPGRPDYYESKSRDFFERVAKGYEQAVERYPDIIVIDAAQPIDVVHAETMKRIQEVLDKRR